MNDEAMSMSAELADELLNATRHADTRDIPVRAHHLKQMGRSPAHCRFAMLSGFDEPTLAKRLGSATHALLLGGPSLVVAPMRRDLRTKAYQEFVAANDNKTICSRSEYEEANRMADAVRLDPRASEVLFATGTKHEQRIDWEWLGRSRRSTPDIVGPDHLAELKTTRDAAPDRFKWDVLRYGYAAALADYSNAIETSQGRRKRDTFIVAVEKKPPYVVQVYRVGPRDLEMGERQCRAWMERLLVCEAAGAWPGYCESIMDLDLPGGDDDELIFGDEDDAE